MHELSLAMEVCRVARERLGPADVHRLRLVSVAVGHEAPVEADNLSFCLEALLAQPPFGAARPVIRRCQGGDLTIDYLEIDDGDPDD